MFDRHDTSGGGGFIAREALGACLLELKVELTQPKHDEIAGTGIVVWQDLHRALDLPKIGAPSSPTRGDPMTYSLSLSLSHSSPSGEGVTEATSTTRTFELFHINGVEKVLGGSTPGRAARGRLSAEPASALIAAQGATYAAALAGPTPCQTG